jgi:hypothetical protein
MALTDAISVACKALGMGADVYFEKDRTKYEQPVQEQPKKVLPKLEDAKFNDAVKFLKGGKTMQDLLNYYSIDSAMQAKLVTALNNPA